MWQEVLNMLFPKKCINCEIIIPSSQLYLCEVCKTKLPFTGIILNNENYLCEKLNLITKIESASALLNFTKNNITQKLIHHLKYKNMPELGEWLAEIWFQNNKDNPFLKKIETVIPVPIHPKRLKNRNYNQLTLCGKRLADLLNCEYDEYTLKRIYHLKSQTQSGKYERMERMKNTFQRTNSKKSHFLLVDDVFTTGSTLIYCTEELLKIKTSQVSIFTLAIAN